MQRQLSADDPLESFYNPDRLRSVGLTFDTDWAPDFVLDDLVSELAELQLAATIFATNRTEALHDSTSIEVSIHPNFMPRSTHGDSVEAVLSTLKTWFPHATGMRSHGLWQSSNILRSLSLHGIEYDSNLLMYDLPYLQAFDTFYDVVRIPYGWSDASHLLDNRPFTTESLLLTSPGQKVLDIHPMLWYLNSASSDSYNQLKRAHPRLTELTRDQADKFVNPGRGIRTLVRDLGDYFAANAVATYRLVDFRAVFVERGSQPYSFEPR